MTQVEAARAYHLLRVVRVVEARERLARRPELELVVPHRLLVGDARTFARRVVGALKR